MSSAPALLDAGLLARLEELLRATGIAVMDTLAPGLSDAQIDAIAEPAGLVLPDEARAWWRWRNGHDQARTPPGAWEVLPGRALLSLEGAVGTYLYVGDPTSRISPVGAEPVIEIECLRGGSAPAPVYRQNDYGDEPELVLPSFGELVLTWIGYLEGGVYATTPEGGWASTQSYSPEVLELGVR